MIEGFSVAVVVPAYRVQDHIGPVLRRMPTFVDRIFVVDDASPDETAPVVRGLPDQRVVLLSHTTNQGVGGAMITGYRAALEAGADLIVKCDGDGQMDPDQIQTLLRPLLEGRAEYAKGCRFHHARELRRMPRIRLLGNVALTLLTKLASGYWHVLDPQNGFVAIQADTLKRLPLERLARGYFFENDMLIRLNAIEARVADVPLASRYESASSSLEPTRVLIDFPPRLVAGFLRRFALRYLFYDVSVVPVLAVAGAVLFLFGAIFGGYHWLANALRGRTTPTGTIIVAVVPLILGFQLLLQALVFDIQGSPRAEPERSRLQKRPVSGTEP